MAQIKRHASATWHGAGKDGTGSLTTQSATLKDTPYGFNSRFGDGKGTNPEELIAAAHAGCFSMATAFQLSGAGHPPSPGHPPRWNQPRKLRKTRRTLPRLEQ